MTTSYHRLHFLVEGQSEEIVVNNVLEPYLAGRGWTVTQSIVTTRRPAGGPNHRGGMSSWSKVEREIKLLLRNSSLDVLTTLFDFYAFPLDAPGMADVPPGLAPHDRVAHVEASLAAAAADHRFVPHLILHELETWVFAAAEQVGAVEANPQLLPAIFRKPTMAHWPSPTSVSPNSAPNARTSTLGSKSWRVACRERSHTRCRSAINGRIASVLLRPCLRGPSLGCAYSDRHRKPRSANSGSCDHSAARMRSAAYAVILRRWPEVGTPSASSSASSRRSRVPGLSGSRDRSWWSGWSVR
ncbi:DUF4276 family protein [Nocardia vulneris]|uniref:DUF4276 family protein n=1 Tax=Nocardia vulneris TaxID=1141657 RepID=UPI0009E336D0